MSFSSGKPEIKVLSKKNVILIMFLLSVLAVLFLSIYTRMLFENYMASEAHNIVERLKAVSISAVSLAPGDELDSYRSADDMKLASYRELREKLRVFSQRMDVRYVYFLRIVDGQIHYIVDNDFDEKTRVGLDTPPVDLAVEDGVQGAFEGRVTCIGIGEYTVGWEGLMSAYAPVYNAKGVIVAAAGVDIEDTPIMVSRRKMTALTALQILSVVFVLVSGLVCLFGYRRAALLADEANRSKSFFLARMSHEIRTPMNAILGMSELAQREFARTRNAPPKALEYASGIRNAGAGLLAIINDILDFSKIETGHMELVASSYETASLFNDALSIARVRLEGKTIDLITGIAPAIPGRMTGDAGRIKQILLNLLSNAVKYTNEGFIKFSASGEPAGENLIRLTFTVEDSGLGIRREDLPRLFGEFTRIDEKRNSAIEGTGLGLVIARNLCRAMGGDITVASEYGKGSVFTATLTQSVSDWKPMGVMTGRPARRMETQHASFIAPEAEVLIVDDFPSNLLVAEGLLIPYRMRVFTCLDGREAVELVRERPFDLVLMDHMMPEMDGVEATRIIRSMNKERCRTLPIIALTANAVSGMKEMFLENGFNDFLSKPIEVPRLDALLKKWIPAGKRRMAPEESDAETAVADEDSIPEIAGVDVAAGIARIGGSRSRYISLLTMFRRDAQAGFALLEKEPDDDMLRAFITRTHGLKTALANIGAEALSPMAALLEKAGRDGDRAVIRDTLPQFREDLAALTARIGEVLARPRSGDDEEPGDPTAEILARLLEALEAKDIDAIYAELPRLQSLSVSGEQREAAGEIVDFILTPDFQKAAEAVSVLLGRENGRTDKGETA